MTSLPDLLDAMASPDPGVRDGWAYRELADGIRDGRFAGERVVIRSRAVAHLGHEAIEARAFAPLILTWLVQAGDRDRAAWDAVARWYVTEPDTRGYDDELGWLHAVAHGADYLAAAVRAEVASPGETLSVLVRRLVADGVQWADQEDARVAAAIIAALSMVEPEAPADASTRWVGQVGEALDAFEVSVTAEQAPARPPMWLRNVTSTLALVHVALAEGPVVEGEPAAIPHASDVRHACGEVLGRIVPWLIRPGMGLVSSEVQRARLPGARPCPARRRT